MAYVIRTPAVPLPAGDYYSGRRAEIPELAWGSVPVISGRGPAMDEHAGYHGYGCCRGYGATFEQAARIREEVAVVSETGAGEEPLPSEEKKSSLAPWFIVGGLAIVGIVGVIAFAPKR